jgi:hypothetical protein
MLFDQFIDIPPRAELFSNGDWDLDLLPKRTIDRRILRTNKVFSEEWLEWFDKRTQADRVGDVEPRMIVDAPVASRPDSVTYLNTIVIGLADHLAELKASSPPGSATELRKARKPASIAARAVSLMLPRLAMKPVE